jgi:hypothetical protein
VVVFNHPTAVDYLVLVAELEERFRFVASAARTRLFRWITTRYDMVLVDPATPGNARRVAEAADQVRKPYVAIAPAAGRSSADQCALPRFGTGAFVAGLPVIPVLLRWTPYERARWPSEESTRSMLLRRFWGGGPIAYSMRVLEPMAPRAGEGAAEHAARVRGAMEAGLRDMEAGLRYMEAGLRDMESEDGGAVSEGVEGLETERHAALTVLSSQLFLVAACVLAWRGRVAYALSVFATYAVSMAYHCDPNPAFRAVDLSLNALHGVVHSVALLVAGNYPPIACLALAGAMYAAFSRRRSMAWHAALVHVPVFVGFMLLA